MSGDKSGVSGDKKGMFGGLVGYFGHKPGGGGRGRALSRKLLEPPPLPATDAFFPHLCGPPGMAAFHFGGAATSAARPHRSGPNVPRLVGRCGAEDASGGSGCFSWYAPPEPLPHVIAAPLPLDHCRSLVCPGRAVGQKGCTPQGQGQGQGEGGTDTCPAISQACACGVAPTWAFACGVAPSCM